MKYIGKLLVCLIFASCNSDKHKKILSVHSFPLEKTISFDSIRIENTILSPWGMITTDSFLIVQNYKKETCFDCFKLPEIEFLYTSINRGNGPSDLLPVDVLSFTGNSNSFNISLQSIQKVKYINVSSSKMTVSESPLLPLEGNITRNLTPLSKDLFLSSNVNSAKYDLQIYDLIKEKTIEFGKYPLYQEINYENEFDRILGGQKMIATQTDLRRFAVFYVWFKEFKIYNFSGDLLKHVYLDIPPSINSFNQNFEERVAVYSKITSTNKYIYAVFHNAKTSSKKDKDEIHVWDWDGNPIAKLIIDINLQFIAVSRDDKILYSYSIRKDPDCFYRSALPDFQE